MLTSEPPAAPAINPNDRTIDVAVMATDSPTRTPAVLLLTVPRSVGKPTAVGGRQASMVDQQYWPDWQVVVCPCVQPWLLLVQVSNVRSPVQLLLAPLPHPMVGAGQLQPATPPAIEQTRPVAAQLVSAS
jgi:hypothetical protein